jgi:hypothetical protein
MNKENLTYYIKSIGKSTWVSFYKFIMVSTYVLPWVLMVALIVVIGKYSWYQNLSFKQIIDLIELLVWPVVAFTSLMFFRKVFTYLFFSLEEFSFFGTKGRLKSVQEMIQTKASELFEKEKRDKEDQEIIKSLGSSTANTQKAIDLAEKLFEDKKTLQREILELKVNEQKLLAQIDILKRPMPNLTYESSLEEVGDIGTTNIEASRIDQDK